MLVKSASGGLIEMFLQIPRGYNKVLELGRHYKLGVGYVSKSITLVKTRTPVSPRKRFPGPAVSRADGNQFIGPWANACVLVLVRIARGTLAW
jgi:hypothetical protein